MTPVVFLLALVILGGAGFVAGGMLLVCARDGRLQVLGWLMSFISCCCLVSAGMLLAVTP